MEIEIQLTNSAIPDLLAPPGSTAWGAWLEFRGLVRELEAGQSIVALDYEAYERMAVPTLRRILEELAASHKVGFVRVIHRIGVVAVGEAALYVGVASAHRGEGFGLLAAFMDRLKVDVPIWKTRALTSLPLPQSSPRAPSETRTSDHCLRPGPATASELLACVRSRCTPLESERCNLADALGRVLREPAIAPSDQPVCDRSTVDGYAVRRDSEASTFRVVDRIRAGEWKPRRLEFDEAVRVATGAALPADELRVVMQEDVESKEDRITVLRPDSDRHVRRRGEEAQAGQTLIVPGRLLRAGGLALLASLGMTRPLVSRRCRVLHLATGDEIVAPDLNPAPGQIRDSNSTLVSAFLARWGVVPVQQRVGESPTGLRDALQAMEDSYDLVLISGGASVGEHDFTPAVLQETGFEIAIRKTRVRPGKPLIVAQRGALLAFGLPGNPLAHFVCLNVYVRAALENWAGRTNSSNSTFGVLSASVPAGDRDRETFWPARTEHRERATVVKPLPWSSSGDLTSLAEANALIWLPAGHPPLAQGQPVEFLPVEDVP